MGCDYPSMLNVLVVDLHLYLRLVAACENVMVTCRLTVSSRMVWEFYCEVFLEAEKLKKREEDFIELYRLVLLMNIDYQVDRFPRKM